MLHSYKQKANNCIDAALVLSVVGFALVFTRFAPMGPPVSLSALPVFALGGCASAKAKGWHWSWGLLGLTSLPGILVLMLFTDRHPEPAK